MADTKKNIFIHAARFFSGTMLSRVSGLARDIAMAYAFGADSAIAAFLVAFRLSHLFRRVLGEGAMQMSYTPLFEGLRKDSPARAYAFFRDLTLSVSLILLAIIIGGGGAVALFAPDNIIAMLTALMLPSLFFVCLYGLNVSLLQCEGIFFVGSAAPIIFNIVWAAAALALGSTAPDHAVGYLAVAIIVATILQWAITVPGVVALAKGEIPSLWRGACPFSPDVRALLAPLSLCIVGVSATQVNSALDALFARYADSSGPAYLWYAIRLQQLPIGLFAVGLSSALLPPLSRAAKEGDSVRFREFLRTGMKAVLAVMLPATAGCFILGKLSISLLFGHGDFDGEAVLGTTHCLWGYAVGLAPTAAVLLLAPAYYAKGNYRLPTVATVVSVLTNIFFNALFVFGMGMGATSVALATSISAFVNISILALPLIRAGRTIAPSISN